ncbi:MAG TPA: ATP-binding protein [Rudaea sp.]|nr:ATP-binding protein [Rudaea sp.]
MPRRLFPRLVLLLGSVLALNSLIGLGLLGVATYDITLQHTARSLETKIVAADVLVADPERPAAQARLAALGIEVRADRPAAPPALRPMHRAIEAELARRLPERHPFIVEAPEPLLWIAAEPPAQGWIGIPLLALRGPLWWSTSLALLAAVLLVFGAAAWATRSLVAPLHTLSAAAPALLAGEPAPELPKGAAREIVELSAALDRAAAQTRAAAEERQLMLAGLSHDMRTPLSRLVFALELIDGDAAIRDGMAADVAELDAILGQFIAFVRDGRDEPSQNVDVGALLDEAIAAQQRVGREWQRLGDGSATLYGKPLALKRALENLLENAARHGGPPFVAELRREETGAVVYVRDGGPGVPADTLRELGRPFYRADAARSGPGSGLGLATVARIAAWHGGALELRNREQGGFEAELRLVAARA